MKGKKVWEKIVLVVGILVGIIGLCIVGIMIYVSFIAFEINEDGNLTLKSEKKYIPTEEQVEILRRSGSWSKDLDDMMEHGMDSTTKAYVETAQMMIGHLEEKYGIEFMVCGGDGGSGLLGSGGYSTTMYALEGEYAYEEFEVKYGVDSEGNPYYKDQYYLIANTMKVQEDLQKIVDDTGLNIKVTLWLNGYIEDVKDKDLYEVLRENHVDIDIIGFMRPDVTEDEFNSQTEKMAELMKEQEQRVDITIFRLTENERFDKIHTRSDLSNEGTWPIHSTKKPYDMRYHEYILASKGVEE